MVENTVFYLSNNPNNGISLPIEGTLTSNSYLNAGQGITKYNLVKVEIGSKVTSIGDRAFATCNKLQSVTIGDSVTSIGYSPFSWCSKLQSVTIGDSVTSIGEEAFSFCRALQSLTIPDSVTSIGSNAFQGSGISKVIMSFKTAQILDLKPNVKQVFFGQNNVYVQTPSSFIQPGIISGTYGNDQTLQNYNFDTGSENVIIRLYVPGKRTYEKNRARILIADFTNIDGTNINNIKWEKRTKNGNN